MLRALLATIVAAAIEIVSFVLLRPRGADDGVIGIILVAFLWIGWTVACASLAAAFVGTRPRPMLLGLAWLASAAALFGTAWATMLLGGHAAAVIAASSAAAGVVASLFGWRRRGS